MTAEIAGSALTVADASRARAEAHDRVRMLQDAYAQVRRGRRIADIPRARSEWGLAVLEWIDACAVEAEAALRRRSGRLDTANRRARVTRKGGATDVIVWQTATARLLPRYLKGRTDGPLFVTERRARVDLPPSDLDSCGRARRSATGRRRTSSVPRPAVPLRAHTQPRTAPARR